MGLDSLDETTRFIEEQWNAEVADMFLERLDNRIVLYLCYDYVFTAMYEGQTQKALIIKRQDYMDKQDYDPWKNK
jgi:hypothetical protein